MEFDETPRVWYPHVARDVWINFSSRIVKFRSSERRENLPFSSSLSLFFFLSFLSCLFSFFPPLFFYIHRIPSLVCSHPRLFSFFIFSFLHFLHSSFSLFSSFLILFDFVLHELIKVGKFPPTFLTCHMSSPCFFFFIFLSLLLHHLRHGSM